MVLGATLASLAVFGWGCGSPSGSTPDGSAVGAGETGGATGAGGTAEATATGGATGAGGSDFGATGGEPGTGGATGAAGSGAGGATGAAGSGAGGDAQGGANGSGGALGGGTGGVFQAGAGGSAGTAGDGLGGVQGGAGGSAGVAGGPISCRPQPAETEWSPIASIGNGVGEPLPMFAVADDDVFVAELLAGIQRWRNGQLVLELAMPTQQDSVRAVWGTSGADVWTVGSRVWHRNATGWTEVPTPVTGPGGAAPGLSLNTVWGRAADDVYVGGNQGILMHWNGAAWTRLPDPLPTSPGRPTIVTGVFASAASDIWIIGTFAGSGAPANIQHWDGATWTLYTRTAGAWTAGSTGTVPRQPPTGIWGSGASDIWIVGGAEMGGVVHYDGVSWTDMPPPGLPADAGLVDITGACANDVWVVGARVTGFDPVTLGDTFEGLVYHFDGAHWTPSIAAPDDLLRGVAVSPGRVWITGGHTLYGSLR